MGASEILGRLLLRTARDLLARFGLLIVGVVLLWVVAWLVARANATTDSRIAERERACEQTLLRKGDREGRNECPGR
jgi:hypothetical protein